MSSCSHDHYYDFGCYKHEKLFADFLANKMWPGLCTQEFLAGEKTIDWEWGSQKHRHRYKALVIFQARGDGGFDHNKPSAAFQHLGD